MESVEEPDWHIQMTLSKKSRLYEVLNGVFLQGVRVEILSGTSLRQVIVDQLGIAEDYLETRIQTLFLNGKAVDDVDVLRISDGSTLALSAAMPGLAGATLRKKGKYAALRQQISQVSDPSVSALRKGWMILKLFNQVGQEQGAAVLKKGICISGEAMLNVFRKASKLSLLADILNLDVNGNSMAPEMLSDHLGSDVAVFLSVK